MPSWQDFVKFFSEQWRVIEGARTTFCLGLFLIGLVEAGMIWSALSWRYGGIIDNNTSEIEILKSENDRLKVVLGIKPATPSALIMLSNQELKAKAMSVVRKLREITSILLTQMAAINSNKKWDDKSKKAAIDSLEGTLDRQFIAEDRSDAFNIDFELRRRLGPEAVAGIIGISPSLISIGGARIDILQLVISGDMPIFDLNFLPTLANGIEQMAKLLPLNG